MRTPSLALAALLFGCAPVESTGPLDSIEFPEDFEVRAEVHDEIATVLLVEFTTEEPTRAWVEYGETKELELSTPIEPQASTHHTIPLLGLPPATDVAFQVFAEGASELVSAGGVLATGQLPAELVEIHVPIHEPGLTSSDPYFIGVMLGIRTVVFAMDRSGRYLWYRFVDEGLPDESSTSMQGIFAQSSEGLLWSDFTLDAGLTEATLHRVDMLGNEVEVRDIEGGHHFFFEHPDGTIAYTAADVRPWFDPELEEYKDVAGDSILEVDRDGQVRTVFSTWDWSEPIKAELMSYEMSYSGIPHWTHANSLSYDADSDTYLMSLGNADTVLEVTRATGQVERSFGQHGEYMPCMGCREFEFQHDPSITEQGTLLLSNFTRDGHDIFIVEYELDEEKGELVDIWCHGLSDDLHAVAGGQATRLDNGNTLMGAGTAGVLREVTPEGEIVWEAYTDLGGLFGQMVPFEDFYR